MNETALKYGAPGLPGVNLIPAEIAERKKMNTVRGLAILAIVGAVALAVLGYLGALAAAGLAQGELDDAAATEATSVAARDAKASVYTDVLAREQQEYALAQVGYGELSYSALTAAFQSVANDSTSFDQIDVLGPNATALGTVDDDLFGGGVGGVTFSARAESLDDATKLLERLEALPGIANVRGTSEAYEEDGATTYYRVSGSAIITDLRLTGRLTPEGSLSGVDAVSIVAANGNEATATAETEAAASAEPSPAASTETTEE
ncbi:hypothetical protein [Demequina phytophila]|uniref:hypothetical protein n=1 Tax=Demequina phytophila TaxID=1638981 RepID=UPI0007851376|nr:hypothetical protein [Demequina phytophila]